jgi:hypothetical protein
VAASIAGRLLGMIDEENLDWRFGRFKFQSKLFFDRAEKSRDPSYRVWR